MRTVLVPASHKDVISVGGHDDFGERSKQSAVGEVDFLCPAEDIPFAGEQRHESQTGGYSQ